MLGWRMAVGCIDNVGWKMRRKAWEKGMFIYYNQKEKRKKKWRVVYPDGCEDIFYSPEYSEFDFDDWQLIG